MCLLDYERKFKLPPGTLIDAIRSNGETGAWAKLDRGELTMESFVKPFNEECSAKVRCSVYCSIGNDSRHVINQNLLKNLGIIKFGLKFAPSVLMCNNDCSVQLNLERSFLVKFGILAPQINFLFYSILPMKNGFLTQSCLYRLRKL